MGIRTDSADATRLRPLYRQNWVVYLKPPFGGPEYVLQYLGRYTHRVAISNHRLVSFTDGQVTFRWRDSAHHNEQKLMTLWVDEFLRRFLLHILPQGFVRIRNFGFLANRQRTKLLPLCLQLLGATPEPLAEEHASPTEDTPDLYRCPKVCRTNEGYRAAHRCRDPASFSTSGDRCGMKRLFLTRILRVLRHTPYVCALPLLRSLLPASPAVVVAILSRGSQLPGTCGREWLSVAQSRHTSTPLLPTIQFP